MILSDFSNKMYQKSENLTGFSNPEQKWNKTKKIWTQFTLL